MSVEAVWDHVAILPNELPFAIGDIISVLDYSSHELWYGNCRERVGWFPSSYVRVSLLNLIGLFFIGRIEELSGNNGNINLSKTLEENAGNERSKVNNITNISGIK